MKRLIAIALLVAAGCGAPAPETHTITGTFLLSNGDYPEARDAGGCSGTGGYSDIKVGTDVVVRNDKAAVVGTSRLDIDPNGPAPIASGVYQCGYAFSVTVPDAPFYEVEVGHRGTLTYSRAEMEANGWAVEFTLGD